MKWGCCVVLSSAAPCVEIQRGVRPSLTEAAGNRRELHKLSFHHRFVTFSVVADKHPPPPSLLSHQSNISPVFVRLIGADNWVSGYKDDGDRQQRAQLQLLAVRGSSRTAQLEQAIRFNTGWLTWLLWLQQLEWQVFLWGSTLPADSRGPCLILLVGSTHWNQQKDKDKFKDWLSVQ